MIRFIASALLLLSQAIPLAAQEGGTAATGDETITCERGAWYNEGDMICFAYETQSSPQCWHFLEKSGERRARVIGADPANDLVVAGQDQVALNCPGPGVGVSYTPAAKRWIFLDQMETGVTPLN